MYFLFKQNHKRVACLDCCEFMKLYCVEMVITSPISGLIIGLYISTASVDSLHSNLKVVKRPLGAKYGKAAFQDNEI